MKIWFTVIGVITGEMCGAGGFLFTVNIVHICQELCQTQSQPPPSSQLVFSDKYLIWNKMTKYDKMTSDCRPHIFVNQELGGFFVWDINEGGKGVWYNYQVYQYGKLCIKICDGEGDKENLKYFISGMYSLYVILIEFKSCFSTRPIT